MNNFTKYDPPRVLLDFLNYIQTIKGKSPNTVLVYFYDLRLFFRFLLVHFDVVSPSVEFDTIDIANFDETLLRKVTLSDLYAFMSFVSRERDNTGRTRARKVATIRSFYNYLFSKAKLIDTNPASELESPKIVKRNPRYLDVQESRRLLTSVDENPKEQRDRDFAIITLFLNCGLRLSELVSINLSNMRDDTLTIIGKGDKERTIYLNEACKQAIAVYLAVRPREGVRDKNALFLSKRKQRISNNMVYRIVKEYLELAGLDTTKYSTHKLRHTAATLMYKYGNVDIRALQEILGHESIATTEIYTHLDVQQLKNAVESNPLADFHPGEMSSTDHEKEMD